MNRLSLFFCIFLIIAIAAGGCIAEIPSANGTTEHAGGTGRTPGTPPGEPEPITPLPPATKNAEVNTSAIPLLLTDSDWKVANDCGWREENISESTALFLSSSPVRALLNEGYEIDGMSYEINFMGNRCRISTHPDAPKDCDWCEDSGPTLGLRYRGQVKIVFMAHLKDKTVVGFKEY